MTVDQPWWQTAVVYQVYPRSFADADGDGVGDVAGLRHRLGYLADLGVDAVWINPWYPSPLADGGYDVADYRGIAPVLGDLDQAAALIGEAHAAGLRVLLDIVPNHTSSAHPWFVAARAADPLARGRYVFRPGRGLDGGGPKSHFGGPAWSRTRTPDGAAGEWYLHLFAPEQPDLDWSNPQVGDEFEDVLRFWFDRGVDGFRVDSAHGLVKAEGLPDADDPSSKQGHPAWDQDGVHDIYRRWRAVADSYQPPRVYVGEAWVRDPERLAEYLRPDELHTVFESALIRAPFRADALRAAVQAALATAARIGSPCTWALSNHDTVRHVTRFARAQPDIEVNSTWHRLHRAGQEPDLALGRARARAGALLALALPGTVYLYQGEELGLEEVEDLPDDVRQDPTWRQSGRTDPGRDGCRVPLPWSGTRPPFGFSPSDAVSAPWLPQPAPWATRTAAAQADDPRSFLSLYRSAIRLRREHLLDAGPVEWLDTGPDQLAFRRDRFCCHLNTGRTPIRLPDGHLLLASAPIAEPTLGPDTAAWLIDP
jgi:alpha-glucosidase